MKQLGYFLMVGLAFTVLQVATVEAQGTAPGTDCAATPGGPEAVAACWDAQTAAGAGGMALGTQDCGGVPCPTGDDTHTDGAQDCANEETPALVVACVAQKTACMPLADGSLPPHCQ